MAIDPRKLRPSDLCRLLNSTPFGEVINERQLYRHRTRAGFRIGGDKHVDLLRYAAWLVHVRHAPKAEPATDPYESLKDRARARNAAIALAGRDIGELPEVVDPVRKEKAARDFRFFCEAYFPLTFHLAWSPDHLKVIDKIEQAVLEGGLFAMAMPRGSGKTTLCECACIWAILYGHREFVCLIGSDEGHAMDMLESIKTEFDGNELLLADFPEVVFPIQSLDGIANRSGGQLYKGERTHIGWTAKEVVLPTIPGATGRTLNRIHHSRSPLRACSSKAVMRICGVQPGLRNKGATYERVRILRDGHIVSRPGDLQGCSEIGIESAVVSGEEIRPGFVDVLTKSRVCSCLFYKIPNTRKKHSCDPPTCGVCSNSSNSSPIPVGAKDDAIRYRPC